MSNAGPRRAWARLLLITFALGLAAPELRAQDDANRTKVRLERYIKRLGEMKGADYWNVVLQIEALGDKAVELLEEKAEDDGLPEPVRLGLAKALASLDALDVAIDVLLELVEDGKDKPTRLLAAELLGTYGDEELESDLSKLLSETFDAPLRIALAKALYNATGSTKGTIQLRSLLKSDDVRNRYAAALALAELEDIDSARLVLTELEQEPSPRGRLARAYLRLDAQTRRMRKLLLGGAGKGDPPTKTRSTAFDEAIEMIARYHVDGDKWDRERLIDAALKGMTAALDRHSSYWTPAEYKAFLKDMNGGFAGVGIYVGVRANRVVVLSPIYSGPAYRAGIRSRDRIVTIDGWPTHGKSLDDCIKRISGDEGTKVKLEVLRRGWKQPRVIEVTRQAIKVKSARHAMLGGGVGYLKVSGFNKETAAQARGSILAMRSRGLKGLVLDLRGNGGGLMKAAVDLVDLFVEPDKLIVYSEGRNKVQAPRRDFKSKSDALWAGPLLVLIDGDSASASEIVAGALAHHKRARLVGARSYGKGTVQQPMQLEGRKDARIKLTIARYYLPDGSSIDTIRDTDGRVLKRGGIEPQVAIARAAVPGWLNESYAQLIEKRALRGYVDERIEQHKKLFVQLAKDDGRDPSRYPDWDAWYSSLKTKAPPQRVREWLRDELRVRVADQLGERFIHDLLEDRQLQKAVLLSCEALKIDPASVDGFKSFADQK